MVFDAILLVATIGLAWRLLGDSSLTATAILFIAFSLLVALVWLRLDAPDIALAEAIIGAGVTGALVLDAALRMADDPSAGDEGEEREKPGAEGEP